MATAEATEYDATTKEIGDKIVGLTLLEAKKLADYLENVHGIKPAAGGAVMMAPAGGGGMSEDSMAKLQQLADLHSQGILTDAEFEVQKQKILQGM